MSEDVSKAETQEVDTSQADPPKGAGSVHEQTREKGEKAREEREKIEQETTREQVERNRKDGLEAPPGD
jgi:porphobilinogen deaminase